MRLDCSRARRFHPTHATAAGGLRRERETLHYSLLLLLPMCSPPYHIDLPHDAKNKGNSQVPECPPTVLDLWYMVREKLGGTENCGTTLKTPKKLRPSQANSILVLLVQAMPSAS